MEDDDAFAVPNGIPGFPAMRRVALFGAGPAAGQGPDDEQALFWLQDLDDGELAFLCVVPWIAFPEYDIDIDEHSLGINDTLDVRILGLITVRDDEDGEHMTVNLRAPLVVDTAKRRLQQVILTDSRWPIRAPFAALAGAEVA
ncbi:MAG: flagellar assembly protein FliW [Ilumatobacteraceae bacterium]